jgi:hypothetical protein
MMNAPTIAQDVNGVDQPGHLSPTYRGADHLSLNEVLFDALRVVLTVVEGQRLQDTDHFSNGGRRRNV